VVTVAVAAVIVTTEASKTTWCALARLQKWMGLMGHAWISCRTAPNCAPVQNQLCIQWKPAKLCAVVSTTVLKTSLVPRTGLGTRCSDVEMLSTAPSTVNVFQRLRPVSTSQTTTTSNKIVLQTLESERILTTRLTATRLALLASLVTLATGSTDDRPDCTKRRKRMIDWVHKEGGLVHPALKMAGCS
jgi:hypothetical protein